MNESLGCWCNLWVILLVWNMQFGVVCIFSLHVFRRFEWAGSGWGDSVARDSFLSGETKCLVLGSLLGFTSIEILIVDPLDQVPSLWLINTITHTIENLFLFLLQALGSCNTVQFMMRRSREFVDLPKLSSLRSQRRLVTFLFSKVRFLPLFVLHLYDTWKEECGWAPGSGKGVMIQTAHSSLSGS